MVVTTLRLVFPVTTRVVLTTEHSAVGAVWTQFSACAMVSCFCLKPTQNPFLPHTDNILELEQPTLESELIDCGIRYEQQKIPLGCAVSLQLTYNVSLQAEVPVRQAACSRKLVEQGTRLRLDGVNPACTASPRPDALLLF